MRNIRLIFLCSFVLLAACTKLTYNEQSAGEAALVTAMDYVSSECSAPLDLSILSIDLEKVDALAPNSRFFHVVVEVRAKTGVVGELNIFVHDNIKILGVPVTNNEIAGTTLRC